MDMIVVDLRGFRVKIAEIAEIVENVNDGASIYF